MQKYITQLAVWEHLFLSVFLCQFKQNYTDELQLKR